MFKTQKQTFVILPYGDVGVVSYLSQPILSCSSTASWYKCCCLYLGSAAPSTWQIIIHLPKTHWASPPCWRLLDSEPSFQALLPLGHLIYHTSTTMPDTARCRQFNQDSAFVGVLGEVSVCLEPQSPSLDTSAMKEEQPCSYFSTCHRRGSL
jgi:hypothetical protein